MVRILRLVALCVAMTSLSVTTPAVAQSPPLPGFAAVSDSRLADATANVPFRFVSEGAFDTAETYGATMSIVWVQLDNWFSEEGADVIASNIRDQQAAPLAFDR